VSGLPGAAGLVLAGFETARSARDLACWAYRYNQFTLFARFLGVDGVLSPNNLIDFYLFNGAMNDLCRESPTPAEVLEPPYAGGQCLTRYRVTTTWSARFIATGVRITETRSFEMDGALGGLRELPRDPVNPFWGIQIRRGIGTANPDWDAITDFYSRAFYDGFQFTLLEVIRVDGLPDNCGSPIPIPRYRDPVPPDSDPPPPIIINPNDGNDTFITNGDVVFNNDGGVSVNFGGGSFNFSPRLDPSGNFFFSPTFNGPNFNAPSGNYTPPPAGEPGGAASTERVETVINNTERIETTLERVEEKLVPCCFALNECTPIAFGSAQSRVAQVEGEIAYVSLSLTTIPNNVRTQAGVDAPDVYYSGWYSFGIEGTAGDRNAVHFEENFYPAPCGMNTFSYTLYTGFSGFLTIYVKPSQNETD
jgi:hypothetical protein